MWALAGAARPFVNAQGSFPFPNAGLCGTAGAGWEEGKNGDPSAAMGIVCFLYPNLGATMGLGVEERTFREEMTIPSLDQPGGVAGGWAEMYFTILNSDI